MPFYSIIKMLCQPMTIDEVNEIFSEQFIKLFGNIVEHCPAAAICILKFRPFRNGADLAKAFDTYLDGLGWKEKLNLIKLQMNVHDKIVLLEKINYDFISQEFGILSPQHKVELNELIQKYQKVFGIPLIASLHSRNAATFLDLMKKRYESSMEVAVNESIDELKLIAHYKLNQIIKEK